ncbi:transposase [Mesorhizobium sp. M0715]
MQAENQQLTQRICDLKEQLRLERLRRYAPRSEKIKDRLFNEAEQAAGEDEEGNEVDMAGVPGTGLPGAHKPEPKKPGCKPRPEGLPRERIEHDLHEDQTTSSDRAAPPITWRPSSTSTFRPAFAR